MANITSQLVKPENSPLNSTSQSARFLPLAIAGLFCFLLAVAMGTIAAFIYWANMDPTVVASASPEASTHVPVAQPSVAPEPSSEPEAVAPQPAAPPAGTVVVPAGESVLAGDDKRPIRRVLVDQFAIAETEVTNAEYAQFIRDTNHIPPGGWNGAEFPSGTADFPVVNVSWKDAEKFCIWKSEKLGLQVRLPSEAEWELAASGTDNLKYPWGKDWKADGAVTKENGGKVSAVKSFSINRSPFGAYDMVGNVWEWVSDQVGADEAVSDSQVETARKQGRLLRIVKGGSAEESSSEMSTQSRYEVPDSTKVKVIGFRYVVVLAKS